MLLVNALEIFDGNVNIFPSIFVGEKLGELLIRTRQLISLWRERNGSYLKSNFKITSASLRLLCLYSINSMRSHRYLSSPLCILVTHCQFSSSHSGIPPQRQNYITVDDLSEISGPKDTLHRFLGHQCSKALLLSHSTMNDNFLSL